MAKNEPDLEHALGQARPEDDAYLATAEALARFADAATAATRAFQHAAERTRRDIERVFASYRRRHEPIGPAPRRLWGEREVARRMREVRRA